MVSEQALQKWINSLPTKDFIAVRKLSRDWQVWFYSIRNVPDDGREPLGNDPTLESEKTEE